MPLSQAGKTKPICRALARRLRCRAQESWIPHRVRNDRGTNDGEIITEHALELIEQFQGM